MSDDEVKAIFVDLYQWWNRHRSDFNQDRAYEEGIQLVRKHDSDLAMNMFVGLFRQMERRKS